MTAPLFVTADETLLDELLRLAAAAGTTPEVAHDASSALRAWLKAPLVLVGEDLARRLARVSPTRRDAVFVVLTAPVPDGVFQVALALGAESVAELPRSEGWLVERLTDVVDSGPARGLTIGVVGGSGGSGATTFACALGQVAGRAGPSVVVDTDPLGPGVDRVLGLDLVDGVRWDGTRSHDRPAECPRLAGVVAQARRRGSAHLVRRARGRVASRPSPCARRSRPRDVATTPSWSTCPGRRIP